MDPVTIAWQCSGEPTDNAPRRHGKCVRCSGYGNVTSLRNTVSQKFTSFDALGSGDGLCPACSWAFTPGHMRQAWHITTETAATLTTSQLGSILQSPLQDGALTLPIRGRKHLLPWAQWATIRVDDVNLRWTTTEVEKFACVTWLRSHGLAPSQFYEDAPPWAWLTRQPKTLWPAIFDHWEQLRPWRTNQTFLAAALKATTKG